MPSLSNNKHPHLSFSVWVTCKHFSKVATVLYLWGAVFLTGTATSVVAEELPDQVRQHRASLPLFTFNQNFKPPGEGRPKSSRASGTRTGSCSSKLATAATDTQGQGALQQRIQAILPDGNFGLTLRSHPQVFLNFNGDVAPFVLLRFEDETGTYSERATLAIDPKQTVQGFALPQNRPPLEVGKNYKWTLLVACDGKVNPYHPIFSGWVQRGAPTSATVDLQQQPISEQVSWYNRHGYWYDTVATLYQTLKTSTTDTAQAAWGQLLEFVNRKGDSNE